MSCESFFCLSIFVNGTEKEKKGIWGTKKLLSCQACHYILGDQTAKTWPIFPISRPRVPVFTSPFSRPHVPASPISCPRVPTRPLSHSPPASPRPTSPNTRPRVPVSRSPSHFQLQPFQSEIQITQKWNLTVSKKFVPPFSWRYRFS